MQYAQVFKGKFLQRPNRFVARVELGGQVETCHVKNTGRCKELLLPGAEVYLEESANPARKTKYDLVAVQKGARLINMDSQAPNRVVEEWLRGGGLVENLTVLRPECRYRHSRFDFYLEANGREAFVEVKGVTLEEGNEAFFPDAPTQRGVKHIEELCACRKDGYDAYLVFVIQMAGVGCLRPNDRTHKAFGDVLRIAQREGVRLVAMDCLVTPDTLQIHEEVPIQLR